MNESSGSTETIAERVVVVAVTRDHAEVWGLDERQHKPLAVVVRHDAESEHRHVKTGQFSHGHESEEGFAQFFTELSNVLSDASEIMIAGHGAGRSNMMESFAEWLSNKRGGIFAKVSEMRYVDLPHTTGRELAALARKWKEQQRVAGSSIKTNTAGGASPNGRGGSLGRRRKTSP